ncbi:DUF5610 domain-containing protein [Marinobacterium jannaschii]|uniref:DUF5610 domain-containing protein n=1 Tax=Marinobacterium jannaschii TaxID=64970 RepID=UPI00068912F0|nr:DUF5610 domain-containing protein [Marinobacterium jannaschii]
MSIEQLGLNQPNAPVKAAVTAEKNEPMSEAPTTKDMKAAQNKAILDASLNVSISSGNDSLSLVFKAAIEKVNELLEPEFGERAIESSHEEGLDVSPEATADRIVSLTTGLFSSYQEANPELQGEDLINRFVDVIGGGIAQGFGEAREILDGLNVLEGDIASNIDKTYALVEEGLQQFKDDFLNSNASPSASSEVTNDETPLSPVE